MDRVLSPEEVEQGYTRYDLDEADLSAVLDDACALSLFATKRVIWVGNAEAALPLKRATSSDQEEGSGALLANYLRKAPPGVVVVFDASRFDFEGEDKAKLDRVQTFFGAVQDQVEFRPYAPEEARRLAQDLARDAGLQVGISEIGLLVESLGGDAARIAQEIEKLSLFAGTARKITDDDIRKLVPNAQAATVFALVSALGRGDRKRSLDTLDTLIREGEYLPLALTFLATQFRLALIAQEAGLRSAQQIQTHFTKLGIRIWRDRAEQVLQTVTAFPQDRLAHALERVFKADAALRDTRPDDRVVVEELVFSLTK